MTALGVLLGVPLLTGYAQWWEIVAILLGLVLLALEIFVIPGFGVAGISGIVLILVGLLMTFVPSEPSGIPGVLPRLPATWMAFQHGLLAVIGGVVASIFISMWLRRFLPRLPYFNRLILNTVAGGAGVGGARMSNGITTAPWPVAEMIGRSVTDLKPGGTAEFFEATTGHCRTISVVSESGFMEAGASIVVSDVKGNRVVVRRG